MGRYECNLWYLLFAMGIWLGWLLIALLLHNVGLSSLLVVRLALEYELQPLSLGLWLLRRLLSALPLSTLPPSATTLSSWL